MNDYILWQIGLAMNQNLFLKHRPTNQAMVPRCLLIHALLHICVPLICQQGMHVYYAGQKCYRELYNHYNPWDRTTERSHDKMVKQAAVDFGYDTPMLFHGTPSFGWTVYADMALIAKDLDGFYLTP